jgi:hypothetical protein
LSIMSLKFRKIKLSQFSKGTVEHSRIWLLSAC